MAMVSNMCKEKSSQQESNENKLHRQPQKTSYIENHTPQINEETQTKSTPYKDYVRNDIFNAF